MKHIQSIEIEILMDLTNSLGQYFDKFSLNAVSCQTTGSTIFVRTSIVIELKYLKTNWS